MEAIILEAKIFKLLGCVYFGDPFHSAPPWSKDNEIGKTWKRFGNLYEKYKEFLNKIREGNVFGYEVHIEPGDYKKKKKFHVFIGLEVRSLDFFPLDMFYKEFPKTKYLFFSTKFKGEDFKYFFQKWLPNSKYEQSYPFIMQSYSPKRFKGEDNPDSLMDWHIPIKEKEKIIK